MKSWSLRWWRDESGASMPEYALILTFVALVVFAAYQVIGTKVSAIYANDLFETSS